jgi:hypothetical protein
VKCYSVSYRSSLALSLILVWSSVINGLISHRFDSRIDHTELHSN